MTGEIKKYGKYPYSIALLHGGPGAQGEMAPVAEYLSKKFSVAEPYQSADSVHKQVDELKKQLDSCAVYPVILAGYSWGAWLAWIFAAKYPKTVKKIILISSGPFLESYTAAIKETRLSRLNNPERQEAEFLLDNLDNRAVTDRVKLLSRIGELMSKADSLDPDYNYSGKTVITPGVFEKVWPEAEQMRKTGELIGLSKMIKCPVTAIHGDYDPHPAEGVSGPLSKELKKFKLILLKNCGHTPWIEKQARDDFFRELEAEITT